jgi:hypothetical protein
MHEREKSDPAIRAGKPTNKAEATSVANAAEPVEQRAGAKHLWALAQGQVSAKAEIPARSQAGET